LGIEVWLHDVHNIFNAQKKWAKTKRKHIPDWGMAAVT